MIQLTPHMRVLVAVEPVDFRRGIDGLVGLSRNALRADPRGLGNQDGMETLLRFRGRDYGAPEVAQIRELIAAHPTASRRALSELLCEAWDWRQANGTLRSQV